MIICDLVMVRIGETRQIHLAQKLRLRFVTKTTQPSKQFVKRGQRGMLVFPLQASSLRRLERNFEVRIHTLVVLFLAYQDCQTARRNNPKELCSRHALLATQMCI